MNSNCILMCLRSLLIGFLWASSVSGQEPVVKVIPIEPYFSIWDYLSGGGKLRNCGYYLHGRFPAFLEYTSTSDYVVDAIHITGRKISPDWSSKIPKPGENFNFGVSGSWSSGPNSPGRACNGPTYQISSLSPWTATLTIPAPQVGFTYIGSGVTPGRFSFASTASDPKRKLLSLEWKFGDGGGDTFVTPTHEYAKPGEYEVTLKATNPAGAFNTAKRTVSVKAPTLDVSLFMVDRLNTRLKLGEVVKVRAKVSANRSGLGSLSNARFDSAPVLGIPEVFQLQAAPESTAIGTLQPGGLPVEMDWTLKVVNAGEFTLRTSPLTATDTAGRPVKSTGAQLAGSVSGLNVDVTFLRDPTQLKKKPIKNGELSSNPGYEPATIPVRVKVSVPKGGKPVENVTLQGWDMSDGGLDIDLVRATGVPGQPFMLVVPQPVPFPLTVQRKPPQPTVPKALTDEDPPLEFDFLVEAEKPGSYAFASLFTAKQVGANTTLQERGSNIQPVLGDLVLSVQVEVVNDPAKIKEGETVAIAGRVKNLTTEETILLDPIQIINLGQGTVAGPVDNKAELPPPGFLGIFNPILKPDLGENEARFRAGVKTARIPGLDQRFSQSYQAVILDFAVGGQVVGVDGALRELAPENIVVEWGNGGLSLGGVTALYVPVEPNPLPVRELEVPEFIANVGSLGFTRIREGLGNAIELENIAQIIASYGQLAWSLSSLAVKAADAAEEEALIAFIAAGRYQWAVTDWFLAVNQGISAKTKSDEIDAIAAQVKAYYGRKFDSVDQVKPIVTKAWNAFFAKLVDLKRQSWDYDYGFNAQTAEHLTGWLRPAAKFVIEEVVQDVVLGLIWKRLVRSPNVTDDVAQAAEKRAAQAATDAETAAATIARRGAAGDPRLVSAKEVLRNLKGGTLMNASQAIRAYAVDKITDANLIKLTDFRNGGLPILVAVRSRADETLEWMSTKLGMTPKPVPIKQKNVNLIDEKFLGYRPGVGYGDELGRGGGDRGSVIIAEPLPPKVIQNRIKGEPLEVQEAVLERYRERWEEWYGKESLPADTKQWPSDDTMYPDSLAFEMKFKKANNKFVVGNKQTTRTTLKGSIEVPKRGSVTDPRINLDVTGTTKEAFEPRELELRQVIDPPDNEHFVGRDREYYEVWLEDEPVGGKGVLKRVSGDVDVVMTGDIAGYRFGLNEAKKTIKEYGNKIARILQHVMKAQHPWSSSLAPVKLRNKYMKDHLWNETPAKRGEPLLVYFNGERRIAYIDPTKAPDLNNVIDPENPLASLVFLDGGPSSIDDIVRRQVADRNDLPSPASLAPKLTPTGFSAVRQALLDNDQLHNTGFLATCAILTGSRSGAIYRLGQNEELQKRGDDGQWASTSPGAECGPQGIVLVPETLLLEDIVAGALRLPILDQLLGSEWRQLFQIGDDVIIAPGTPEEEVNTISNHGSLILSRPTKFSHPAGTLIMLVPPRLNQSALASPPSIWLRADAGVELLDGNVLTWTDQAGGMRFVNPEGGRDGLPFWLESTGLSLPAIQFRGDEWISGGMAKTLTNATIFTLSRYNVASTSGADYLYSIGMPGTPGAMMTLARRNGDNAYHWDGKNHFSPDTVVPANAWQVFTQVYGEGDPARQQLFLNGHPLIDTKAAAPYKVDATEMYLGNYQSGSNFLIGDLVEWIVFDRVLPPTERQVVQDYLKKRGGLLFSTATPPGFTLHLEPSTQTPGSLSFSWPATLGQEYDLERSETMSFDSWVRDRTVKADRSGTFQLEITPAPGSRNHFYRLRQK